MRAEMALRFLDIRQQQLNASAFSLSQVCFHLIRVLNKRIQHSRVELSRPMAAHIRGDECDFGITRRMGTVEGVGRELDHLRPDILSRFRRDATANAAWYQRLGLPGFKRSFIAVHEQDMLLVHHVFLLFAAGFAEHIGLAKGIACEPLGNLHQLLLIDHDAECGR